MSVSVMTEDGPKQIASNVDPDNVVTNEGLDKVLEDYVLVEEAGYSLNLHVEPETYVMEIQLKNKKGDVISSQDFDFPIETAFVNVEYNKITHEIIFTLQNGTKTEPIDISDIVRGLVPDSRTIAGIDLKDDITKEELRQALEVPSIVNGLSSSSATDALSAIQGKILNDKFGGYSLATLPDGSIGYKKDGADTVYPFKSSGSGDVSTGYAFDFAWTTTSVDLDFSPTSGAFSLELYDDKDKVFLSSYVSNGYNGIEFVLREKKKVLIFIIPYRAVNSSVDAQASYQLLDENGYDITDESIYNLESKGRRTTVNSAFRPGVGVVTADNVKKIRIYGRTTSKSYKTGVRACAIVID